MKLLRTNENFKRTISNLGHCFVGVAPRKSMNASSRPLRTAPRSHNFALSVRPSDRAPSGTAIFHQLRPGQPGQTRLSVVARTWGANAGRRRQRETFWLRCRTGKKEQRFFAFFLSGEKSQETCDFTEESANEWEITMNEVFSGYVKSGHRSLLRRVVSLGVNNLICAWVRRCSCCG